MPRENYFVQEEKKDWSSLQENSFICQVGAIEFDRLVCMMNEPFLCVCNNYK